MKPLNHPRFREFAVADMRVYRDFKLVQIRAFFQRLWMFKFSNNLEVIVKKNNYVDWIPGCHTIGWYYLHENGKEYGQFSNWDVTSSWPFKEYIERISTYAIKLLEEEFEVEQGSIRGIILRSKIRRKDE